MKSPLIGQRIMIAVREFRRLPEILRAELMGASGVVVATDAVLDEARPILVKLDKPVRCSEQEPWSRLSSVFLAPDDVHVAVP